MKTQKEVLKEGWYRRYDRSLQYTDVDGRVFHCPLAGGMWIKKLPDRYVSMQLAGSSDVPFTSMEKMARA